MKGVNSTWAQRSTFLAKIPEVSKPDDAFKCAFHEPSTSAGAGRCVGRLCVCGHACTCVYKG